MSLTQALITTVLIAVIIFLERLFPFVVFSKKAPGKLIHWFERYIPPFVMLGLLIYSLKSVRFSELVLWVPPLAGVLFAAVTYFFKKNSLLSIFGSTILYMILIRIM